MKYWKSIPLLYVDPSGEFFVLVCVIVGDIIRGTITYNLASNAGYEGIELVLLILLGTIGGGLFGYFIAP